jgi:hypothetical protein
MGGSSLALVSKDRSANVVTERSAKLLDALAKALQMDLVSVIPDGMWGAGFSLSEAKDLKATLNILASYLDLGITETEVRGRMPIYDFGAPTQNDRAQLDLALKDPPPVFDTPSLSQVEARQPPLANLASSPILVLLSIDVPMEGTPHYPYDVRLYRTLSPRDWQVLRADGATLADLSPGSQKEIRTLLLKSRMVFEASIDPTALRRLPARQVPVGLEESEEEAVFFRYGRRPPELMDVANLAGHRAWRQFEDDKATYQVVSKRQLILSIGGFKVPFVKVTVPPGSKYVRFAALPAALRVEIEKAMTRPGEDVSGGAPPP